MCSYLFKHFRLKLRECALIIVAILSFASSHAQNTATKKFQVKIQPGYFNEDFRWSIGGYNNSVYVNILSEIRWQNLSGPTVEINTQYNFWKQLYVGVNFSNSFITSGTVSDTDFGQDNRKDTLYYDSFDSNKGRITAIDITLGYPMVFLKKYLFTPFLGYVVNQQSLFLLHDFGNVVGDLKSNYEVTWQGFTGGIKCKIPLAQKIIVESKLTYNQVNYSSKANWNLIEEFKHPVSFRHSAKGFGIEPSLSFHYRVKNNIDLFLGGKTSYWTTGTGVDRLFLADGQIAITQFNGSVRKGYAIFIGTTVSF
jgi:hypothetical protein